ncbi:MAG: protein meaA [Rhodospirillales bacterium]
MEDPPMGDAFANAKNPSKAPNRDQPWLFRTYSGHSSAAASNALYRANLAKGQTGLSVAFDLPTQTALDADHPLARGEVGRVGVPICCLGDMETLFEGIPLAEMNTSMTINAPAAWLLALYIAAAERQGAARAELSGTVQNDIIKEYLSRGAYVFPPGPSLKLTADVIAFTLAEAPKWNPINVCSYHLQEAGAEPVQELAYALAAACAVLDAVKASGQVKDEDFPAVAGRVSFFVNAGVRFVTEMCKMRAFTELWDDLTASRYGVKDPKFRRFRYGVQVNSLGLTEQQPENNIHRILLEMLAVTLSKNARARAVQLPAWNEALGLPRPWDQQWSLRAQQILAYETDLLEFGDLFDGSREVAETVKSLKDAALAELKTVMDMGGAVAAVEQGYMKRRLVESHAARVAAVESGAQTVVGVNAFTEAEPSPFAAEAARFQAADPKAESEQMERLKAWRAGRDAGAVKAALAELESAATEDRNIMPASVACAHAGVTTGEWGQALRGVYGEYRAPTGVQGVSAAGAAGAAEGLAPLRARVRALEAVLGRRPRILVGKPGLDGHSNGAEQIAVRARDAGFDVVYEGIRSTPRQIVRAAADESVHVVGLSILSGAHMALVRDVLNGLAEEGVTAPVVVGGIIPDDDAATLMQAGVARIFTPRDFDLNAVMAEIIAVIEAAHADS